MTLGPLRDWVVPAGMVGAALGVGGLLLRAGSGSGGGGLLDRLDAGSARWFGDRQHAWWAVAGGAFGAGAFVLGLRWDAGWVGAPAGEIPFDGRLVPSRATMLLGAAGLVLTAAFGAIVARARATSRGLALATAAAVLLGLPVLLDLGARRPLLLDGSPLLAGVSLALGSVALVALVLDQWFGVPAADPGRLGRRLSVFLCQTGVAVPLALAATGAGRVAPAVAYALVAAVIVATCARVTAGRVAVALVLLYVSSLRTLPFGSHVVHVVEPTGLGIVLGVAIASRARGLRPLVAVSVAALAEAPLAVLAARAGWAGSTFATVAAGTAVGTALGLLALRVGRADGGEVVDGVRQALDGAGRGAVVQQRRPDAV